MPKPSSGIGMVKSRLIFPHPGMIEEFRRRTNRMVYPIRIHKRERKPVAVMWTKSRKDVHHEDHFVPIFKM